MYGNETGRQTGNRAFKVRSKTPEPVSTIIHDAAKTIKAAAARIVDHPAAVEELNSEANRLFSASVAVKALEGANLMPAPQGEQLALPAGR